MNNSIILPRIMNIGGGSIEKIQTVLDQLDSSNPFLITDEMMVKLGYVKQLASHLKNPMPYFSETEPEPTTISIDKGVIAFKKGNYDSIIALGGGSVIDSTKAIAVLAHNGGTMRDYKVPHIVNEPCVPIVAIPTTAGTGSEATNVSIISDVKTSEKMLCIGNAFMPIAVIIDYKLSMSAPPRVTADTGIDALSHAVEAYVSRKANPFSDGIALRAMQLIGKNLRKVYIDGQNAKAREELMLGATLGGVSFCNSSVALIHGMSRPIGVNFHVPHGMSNAMLFPTVTEYSLDSASQRYADCARAIGVASLSDSDESAGQKFVQELMSLNHDLDVPTPEDFGIKREAFFAVIETMSEQALASGSPNNNPKIPTKEEISELYKKLW